MLQLISSSLYAVPPEITNETTHYVFDRGAVITWNTETTAALSEIEYGLTPSFGSVGTSPIGYTTNHNVTLHQLQPNTLYHARVRATNQSNEIAYSENFTFTTTVVPDFDSPCVASTTANDYPVGPGQLYENIGDVPWESLGPGDTVRIFWRNTPYREKFQISTRGSAAAPIRICGIPGPNGERPIIDGENATTRPQLTYSTWTSNGTFHSLEDYSTVMFNSPYGTRPGYIVFEGLCVRGAYEGNSFTATDGSTRNYVNQGASPIRMQKGDNIVIRNCEITGGSNGLFILSNPSGEPQHISREIRIEGNYIHNNGTIGSDREHNSYVQTLGVTYRYNRYGPMRPGSKGSALKDRSSGTVIAYNWIEGGARTLDLVEGEEHYEYTTRDDRYRKTYVYGNILQVGEEGGIIHYGGDNGNLPTYRKGTLYFFNNTLYSIDSRWRTSIFDVSTVDEHAEIFNNVLYREGISKFQILRTNGIAHLGPNWINTGWEPWHDAQTFNGTLTGTENLITGPTAPFNTTTFKPITNSSATNTAISIPAEIVNAGHALSKQINPSLGGEAFPMSLIEDRVIDNGILDLGAIEGSNNLAPPVLTTIDISPNPAFVVQGGQTVTFTLQGEDQYGNPIAISDTVAWSVDSETNGSINQQGVFTSLLPGGPYTVQASVGALSATASLTITETPVLTTLQVGPLDADVTTGTTQQYVATPKDQYGNPMSVTVNWSLSGNSDSSISTTGLLTAGSVGGPYTITAQAGSLTVQTTVTIVPVTLPDQVVSVFPASNSTDVAWDSNLVIQLTSTAIFNWTTGGEIRIYQAGNAVPIWTHDPAGSDPAANPAGSTPDPNNGSSTITLDIPQLSPNTTYYVLTSGAVWARINAAPYFVGHFNDSQVWRFTTRSAFRAWQYAKFPSDVNNPTIAGPGADPDKDLRSNLEEYALNLNPLQYDEVNPFSISTYTNGADSYAEFTFPILNVNPGIQYQIQSSNDLVTWDDGCLYSPSTTTTSSTPNHEVSRVLETDVTRITVRSNTPKNAAEFFRLEISEVNE